MKENNYIYPNFPKELIKSQLHLDRYMKFINSRPKRGKIKFETEYHHKVPKALGGADLDANKLHLTHREHFIAHLMLWKAFENTMTSAFHLMQYGRHYKYAKLTSRQFSNLKEDLKNVCTIKRGESISKAKIGSTFSKESKQLMSKTHTGMIQVYKDQDYTTIHPEQLQAFLLQGWTKGRLCVQKWKVKNPKGELFIIEHGLSGFCKKHSLSRRLLMSQRGHPVKLNTKGNYNKISFNTVGWMLFPKEGEQPNSLKREAHVKLYSPDGSCVEVVSSLQAYCKEHNLSQDMLQRQRGRKVTHTGPVSTDRAKNTVNWMLL